MLKLLLDWRPARGAAVRSRPGIRQRWRHRQAGNRSGE